MAPVAAALNNLELMPRVSEALPPLRAALDDCWRAQEWVRRRSRGAVAIALAVLIALAYGYIHTLESKFPGGGNALLSRAPFLWTILLDRNFTPLVWIVAWILGLVVGLRRRAAWVALLSLLGLDVLWRWTGVYTMFVGHARQVASARYESILLVPFAIGMALLVQAAGKARPWLKVSLVAASVACTAVTFRRPFETLLRPFTIDYEYRFLKKFALTLAPHSRLYVFDSPVDEISGSSMPTWSASSPAAA
jgi:hypothetical protein